MRKGNRDLNLTDSPTSQLTGNLSGNVNWKRRNWCAAAILVLYFAVNALAIGFYHFASPTLVEHDQSLVTRWILGLGVALTVFFFATAWFWAKAKNWPGFVGTIAALMGSILWLGCAVAVIAPAIAKLDTNEGDPAIPIANWLPILPWVAFIFTAVVLKFLPVRKTATALPDAA